MMSYLRNCCREIPITDAQLEAYIDNSQPTIDYYDEIFARCSEPVHSQVSGLFGDYQAEWEGGVTNASHSVSYGGVTKWKNAYLEAIELCGGKLLTSTKANQVCLALRCQRCAGGFGNFVRTGRQADRDQSA